MIKIFLIAIICGIICLYLKNTKSELFALSLLGSSIILSYYAIVYLSATITVIDDFINESNISNEVYQIIIKVIGIGLITEYGNSFLEDLELKSLANKIIFIGRLLIIFISIPIFKYVIEIIKNLLNL